MNFSEGGEWMQTVGGNRIQSVDVRGCNIWVPIGYNI